jgi:hypothetical protein
MRNIKRIIRLKKIFVRRILKKFNKKKNNILLGMIKKKKKK